MKAEYLLAGFRRRFLGVDAGLLEVPEVVVVVEVPGGWEMTVSRPEYLEGGYLETAAGHEVTCGRGPAPGGAPADRGGCRCPGLPAWVAGCPGPGKAAAP